MTQEQLGIMRHSISHLMSMAVQELYPQVGLGVGPAIENGFYQDYDLPEQIGLEIFPKLEKRMRQLIAKNIEFVQHDMSFKEARKQYKHDPYKTELIDDLEAAGEKSVSFYKSDFFENLCKGPHVKSTKEINPDAFKLMKLAGAYWRGDEKNKMLTRIYGVAFETKAELDNYLNMLAEAEKRDHRKIGKEMELFLIDQTVGMGLPMWFPKGALIWRIMEDFWYKEHLKNGYDLVRSPHIGSRKLWETSGHWGFFSQNMYPPLEVGQTLEDIKLGKKSEVKEEYLIKPMNCPFHVVLYKARPRSYRELPLRWAECGTVYRYEKAGELSGLTRVRGFTQDDAHIICSKEQVKSELMRVVDFITFMLSTFGFKEYNVYLSLRDPHGKAKYAGNDEGWDFTQKVLEEVAIEKKLNFKKEEGEAAFYGPKLDFKIKDSIGREWQCSTLQFDFNLPERFELRFVNDQGQEEQPYMLHRALFGSFERFIGVLIENYAGALPVWLMPVQVKILPVSDKFIEYAKEVKDKLLAEEIRVELDDSADSLGKKIRNGEKEKVPYLLVIGEKEVEAKQVAVRKRQQGDLGAVDLVKFMMDIKKEINDKL